MSKFQYAARSPEQWAKREKGSTFQGFILDQYMGFSPKKENWVRFLPPTWDNPGHYGIDVWVHYSVGPENATVLCLYKMTGKPCPICEAHAKLEADGREDAASLRATRRVLAWVINRKEEKDKKPQYWAQPQTVDKEITKICRDRVSGALYYIDHPDQGYDVLFDKEGEGMTTKYMGFQIARQASSIDDAYLDYAIANPLPNILLWRSYDEVKDLFEGTAGPITKVNPGQPVGPTNEQVLSGAPAQIVPPPVIAAPPPTPPQIVVPPPPPTTLCTSEIEYQGNVFGCSEMGPHPNKEHNHQRYIRPAVAQAPTPPPPPQVTATPPTNSGASPTIVDRTAGLRDRFKTGRQQ
jgi:hypothetical protein